MGWRSKERMALKWMTDDAVFGMEAVLWIVEHAADVSRSFAGEFPALTAPCLFKNEAPYSAGAHYYFRVNLGWGNFQKGCLSFQLI